MILSAEKDRQNAYKISIRKDIKPDNRSVFGDMPKPWRNLVVKRTPKGHPAYTFRVLPDLLNSNGRMFNSCFDILTESKVAFD